MNKNDNTNSKKRIISWGVFIVIIGLIIWGMLAASNKAKKENANVDPVDKAMSNDWSKGATTTGVTLIEYSDFQCPACAAYHPLVEEVFAKNSAKFQLVHRHFPLTQHPNAIPAAKASEAAGKQGKFWEMYNKLFISQKEWENSTKSKALFSGYAKELGLDVDKFSVDFGLPEISAKIDASVRSGIKAGVNSTPTFFLNGKKVNPQTYEQFKKLIDEAATTSQR